MRWLVALLLAISSVARAQAPCRTVEVAFKPVKNLQIAVWAEDAQGNYVATLYVTRLTGTFGLANRPGNHFLRTDVRAPYGRRDMVLPVWAHKRNKTYGYVVMGGLYGNSPSTCPTNIPDGTLTVCNDDTIAYHAGVSSPEPFYCSPSGATLTTNPQGVDVVSCASPFNGSKGAYANDGRVSYYPPRADLTSFGTYDGPDARAFSTVNDLGAVSGATPQLQTLLDPPIRWRPPADGQYVIKVEASLESDTNAYHNYSYTVDVNGSFNTYGKLHDFIGQPSVIYSVPVTVGPNADEETTSAYEGYAEFDMTAGSTGKELPPDMTITDMPGTGAGRLLDVTDGGKTFRLRARSSPVCDPGGNPGAGGGGTTGCTAPLPVQGLTLTPGASGTSIDVSFSSAATGVPTNRFDVRYRDTSIDDGSFTLANPSDMMPPPPGDQGSMVTTTISGLKPQKSYWVAVRAFSTCDAGSIVSVGQTTTGMQKFVVLNGCFIATAAYGTPMARQLAGLRALRDRLLLTNPLGRLAVAAYYAMSPPIARAIASDERLRAGARKLLGPLTAIASKHFGVDPRPSIVNP